MYPCFTCKYWTWSWQPGAMKAEFRSSPLGAGVPIVHLSFYPSGSIWRDYCWHPDRDDKRDYFSHVGTCFACDGYQLKYKGEI